MEKKKKNKPMSSMHYYILVLLNQDELHNILLNMPHIIILKAHRITFSKVITHQFITYANSRMTFSSHWQTLILTLKCVVRSRLLLTWDPPLSWLTKTCQHFLFPTTFWLWKQIESFPERTFRSYKLLTLETWLWVTLNHTRMNFVWTYLSAQ